MAPNDNNRHFHRDSGRPAEVVIDALKKPHEVEHHLPAPMMTGGLEFTSLTYTVIKKEKVDEKWISSEVDLLSDISGYAPKGCVTAVMGPSGAGKSTFLDGLAGRIASGSLRGRVALDGAEMNPSLVKRMSAYIMQDDRLFPMLTVYETLMFAADLRLGPIPSSDKKLRVEKLIEQLGLTDSRNTYIGDEGTRGISGGERRRVSIGIDIIHGPSLLFLDEPTSGLDSTNAYGVIEKVHHIARSGSTVILTIHQPSSRIQLFLDHLIVLAQGQLIYQGSPKDVAHHLGRMGRRVPPGESATEYLIDVIQDYNRSELGVGPIADFRRTGVRPPLLPGATALPSPSPMPARGPRNAYDHSVRPKSPWSGTQSGVMEALGLTRPSDWKSRNRASLSPSYYYSKAILSGTPTPRSSDYTVKEADYLTQYTPQNPFFASHLAPNFANPFLSETWVLMRRNFVNIRRTPELFLSRQMVLTVMGLMMATMFMKPKDDTQGITARLSFFIFTVCLFFFSSNDAVPAFIQERFIFVRETSHNAYRASSYVISGLITYLPFLALQAATYSGIVWFALSLRGEFLYFLLVLYVSLISTNSFVMFVSSVVPNYILGYASVIAFTALFFLFCGYFLNHDAIPRGWRWMNVISTMKYPYEGLLINEYATTDCFAKMGEICIIKGTNILDGLAITTEEKQKWYRVLYLIGWAIFYRILFYIVLRFASKNQRT
ncbi:hypothetical protein AMTRI_Chr13g89690 [Amborella trichopoda]